MARGTDTSSPVSYGLREIVSDVEMEWNAFEMFRAGRCRARGREAII
jgi:hypothetical protein